MKRLTASHPILLTTLFLAACASRELPQSPSPISYTCNGGLSTVEASYPNPQTAVVTIHMTDSTPTRTLHQTPSASGVRYDNATTNPAKPGTLIWWTKGPEAILYLVVNAAEGQHYTYEKQLANCTSTPTAAPLTPIPTR